MSFWKKSDDPWDWKDEEERRPRKAPAPPPEEGQPAEPGLWGEIKDLGKVLTESWSPRQKEEDPHPAHDLPLVRQGHAGRIPLHRPGRHCLGPEAAGLFVG